jgi:hypothetical protein
MVGWRWGAQEKSNGGLFEEIRREYEFGVASISGVARKFGVHRRMVREAIESSIPMQLPAKARPRPWARDMPSARRGLRGRVRLADHGQRVGLGSANW